MHVISEITTEDTNVYSVCLGVKYRYTTKKGKFSMVYGNKVGEHTGNHKINPKVCLIVGPSRIPVTSPGGEKPKHNLNTLLAPHSGQLHNYLKCMCILTIFLV